MALINLASREINYKIVYYGCGLSGKTTNIQYIYDRVNPAARGRLFSIATEEERTLYFDFLPLSLGDVRGLRTRFHIYTVPGQFFYNASRRLVLEGVDGVVFVVDSQIARLDENVESYLNLWENLMAQGEDPARLALVLQMNKRDLDDGLLSQRTGGTAQPHRLSSRGGIGGAGHGRVRDAQDRLQAGRLQKHLGEL